MFRTPTSRRLRSVIAMGALFAAGTVVGSLLSGPTPLVVNAESRTAVEQPKPATAPALADGADGAATTLSGGAMWYPWAPGPGELGANPQAFSYDHVLADGRTAKKVLAAWTRNEDSPTAPLVEGTAAADDNGQVFEPYDALPTDFSLVASAQLRSGTVLAVGFIPISITGANRIGIRMASSTDVAKTWTTYTAPLVENKWKLSWYRVHRDLLELPDGTLLLGAYGQGTIDGVTKMYSLVFQSTDGGKSFSQRSAVNAGGPYATGELGMGRTSDGRLIAVMRGGDAGVENGYTMQMRQTFSDDNGQTWEPLKPFVPPAGMPDSGIMPEPKLLPNGQLLLSYGRPDNNVVVSRDGTGKTWDDGEMLYSRHPGDDLLRRWMGSSGNMALVGRDASSALAFGDTCHNIWMCREYGHDNKIWTRIVDAKGPGVGKIDLTTKVADGTVKLTADVAAADSRFPEQRLQGAVDGSGEYRAAVRFADRSASARGLIIQLDKPYQLDRIGLMMDTGVVNSAQIQFSTDGKAWSRPIKIGDRTDYAMHYTDFGPQTATYVRIMGLGSHALTAVTEVELYAANLMTFENDAVTTIPRNLKDTRYALVADKGTVAGYDHSRARLALQDNDQTARAQATIPNPAPAATQHYNFGYEGYGYGSGAIWEVLGTNASGEEVVADRLLFASDSANNRHVLKQWDGTNWQVVGYAGPFVPNKSWMNVDIYSDGSGTTVAKDGVVMGTSNHRLNTVTKFTGLRVETGQNPEDVGNMEHSYDDVTISAAPAPTVSALSFDPKELTAGTPTTVTATVTNPGSTPASSLLPDLSVPTGWTVTAGQIPDQLAGGASATLSWTVTPPAGTKPGSYPISLTLAFLSGTELVQTGVPVAATVNLGLIPRGQMTATASSFQPANPPALAIDGSTTTFWHTQYSPTVPPLPQSITLDFGRAYQVTGLTYLPRQDSSANGTITGYRVYGSSDGTTFTAIGSGTWAADKTVKTASFGPANVKYLRLEATAGVGGFAAAADLDVFGTAS